MHTIYIMSGGLLLFLFLTLLGKQKLLPAKSVIWLFIPLWFMAAAINMWIGVSQAGYSVMEEIPFFLIVFLVPTVIAFFLHFKIFNLKKS